MPTDLTQTAQVVSENLAENTEVFYQSAEFWVGMTFILLVAILFSPIVKILKNMTQQRIEHIKDELTEAENLKLDAQKLYADYERKFINTDKEVAEILENQINAINKTKEKKTLELEYLLKHKQNQAEATMSQRYKQEQAAINKLITDKSLSIIKTFVKEKLTKNDYNKLIDDSIDNIKNLEMR